MSSRSVATAALGVGAILVLYLLLGGGGSSKRTFTATVPAAVDVLYGQWIDAGGHTVGSVTHVEPIDRGHAARITMKITDADYWPLPRDSKLEVRLGGTVSTANRYLLLTRGKDRAHVLADGDALPPGAVKTPVEIDELIDTFQPGLRHDIRRLLDNAAPVLDKGGPALNSALAPDKTPRLVRRAADLTADLTKDTGALQTVVRSTGRVLTAADTATPDVRVLLDGVGQTAEAFAAEATSLKTTLTQFPAALRQTRKTLGGAEVTLRAAGRLTDELSPGVTQLRASVTPLRRVFAKLREVTPLGVRTLRGAATVGPVVPALDQLTAMVPELKSTLDQAATQLGCIRPYTPEIVGLGTGWGDFTSPADTKDRMVRTNFQAFLPAAGLTSNPFTAAQAIKANPGTTYGFPRPPGQLVDQPWFQPQCGVTKDSLDPAKDPESADFVKNRDRGLVSGR